MSQYYVLFLAFILFKPYEDQKHYNRLTKKILGKYPAIPQVLDGKITSKYGTGRLCRVKSSIYYLVLSDVVLNIRCTSDLGG